jgi:uncharacterized RDD family membrane protein YckC
MSGQPRPADLVSMQGRYSGSVSRFLAYAIDLVVSAGLFALGLAATSFVAQVVTGHSITWNRSNIVVAIIFVVWEFFYFGYSWAASGRTLGMAVLGVRVIRADGAGLDPWRGVVRALVFPLSFLLFGLGFLGILVQREHRALHDLIAGSAVIYAWDARAARLRFLARAAELGPGGGPPGPATSADTPVARSTASGDLPHSRDRSRGHVEPLRPRRQRPACQHRHHRRAHLVVGARQRACSGPGQVDHYGSDSRREQDGQPAPRAGSRTLFPLPACSSRRGARSPIRPGDDQQDNAAGDAERTRGKAQGPGQRAAQDQEDDRHRRRGREHFPDHTASGGRGHSGGCLEEGHQGCRVSPMRRR